jgi:hypothetical protein
MDPPGTPNLFNSPSSGSQPPGTHPFTPLGIFQGNPQVCNSPNSPGCYAQQEIKGTLLYDSRTDSLKPEYQLFDEHDYNSPNIYYIQTSKIPPKRRGIESEFPIPDDLPKIIANTTGRNNNIPASKLVLFYMHGAESFQKDETKRIHPILSKICACLKLGTIQIPSQSYCEMEYQQIFLQRLLKMTEEYYAGSSAFLPLLIAEIDNIEEVEKMRLMFMENNEDIIARNIKDIEFAASKQAFIVDISNTSYENNKEMLLEVTLEFGKENIKEEDEKDKELIRLLLMKIEELTKKITEQTSGPQEGNTVPLNRTVEGGHTNQRHTPLRTNAQHMPRAGDFREMPAGFNFADLARDPGPAPAWSPSFLTPGRNGVRNGERNEPEAIRQQSGPVGTNPTMAGGSRRTKSIRKNKKTLKSSNKLKKTNKKTRKVKSRK